MRKVQEKEQKSLNGGYHCRQSYLSRGGITHYYSNGWKVWEAYRGGGPFADGRMYMYGV